MLRPPIQPILAKNISRLPAADARASDLLFEPKWDGFRCLAFHDLHGQVELQSRQGRTLTRPFPDIARLIRYHTPAGAVLDGVI